MRTIRLVLALLFALACPAWAGAPVAPPASMAQLRLSFAPIVKQVAPAVVNIYTRRVVQISASPFANDPFFRHFFGDTAPPGATRERVQSSLGSGVIIGADGTVVTNHHVIADADEVTVVLSDKREFEAKIVGSDERSDIAVLKIGAKGEKLPTLAFGDSDALEVGDLVLAIGNPFGVGQTVTSGIVSALARTNVGVTDYRSFIQTDAAINPGNSGGALVDMDGHLIGINSAIYSKDGGGSLGIGFAIPATMVRAVVASISQTGKVVRPWLGVSAQTVTPEIAQALHLPRPVGVVINNIAAGSPALAGGLAVGDVVLAVNGHDIDDPEGMRFRLATLPMGSDAHLTVLRGTEQRGIDVRLVPPPETPPRDATDIGGNTPLTGATLANLNPALSEELAMHHGASGVVVTRIKRGSIAQRFQIQPGDLILRVNDHPVASVADARQSLAAAAGGWRITLSRDGQTMTLQIGG